MGNTRKTTSQFQPRPVHPHVHGEHVVFPLFVFCAYGSSPRTWGTPISVIVDTFINRFIPTYMGNTFCFKPKIIKNTVHPHVHGEHHSRFKGRALFLGSSPRTWGTQFRQLKCRCRYRFIPTYMGNTLLPQIDTKWFSVHPHVHGEHLYESIFMPINTGSSPRTWGTRQIPHEKVNKCRFIPTYMGNTLCR